MSNDRVWPQYVGVWLAVLVIIAALTLPRIAGVGPGRVAEWIRPQTSTSTSPSPTVNVMSHLTTKELRDLCITMDAVHAGHCGGYVQGVVDGIYFATAGWKVPTVKACVPQGATTDELVRVTLKIIDAHPEELSSPAASVVWNALAAAYPCPAK